MTHGRRSLGARVLLIGGLAMASHAAVSVLAIVVLSILRWALA